MLLDLLDKRRSRSETIAVPRHRREILTCQATYAARLNHGHEVDGSVAVNSRSCLTSLLILKNFLRASLGDLRKKCSV